MLTKNQILEKYHVEDLDNAPVAGTLTYWLERIDAVEQKVLRQICPAPICAHYINNKGENLIF
mgnify:CR=1 FL=1